jgi:hypothetical protein
LQQYLFPPQEKILKTQKTLIAVFVLGLPLSSVLAQQAIQPVAPAAPAAPAAETVPSLAVPSTATPLLGGDVSTGMGQRAATAGYELAAGIGSESAGEAAVVTSATKGRPVRFDNGIFVYPAVTLGVGRNDNVAGTATNKVSSSITTLRPEVVAELKRRGDRYTLSYAGNFGWYGSSSNDDFDYHEIMLSGDNYLTSRARLGWQAGYVMRSDARGSNDAGAGKYPNEWRAPTVRVLGKYGAAGAMGRVELEGNWMQKRYVNNRATTRAQDVDLTTVSSRFYYRVMPKTSALFELRNTWSDYALGTSTQDNSDMRLYAGVEWDATAKTTGSLRLGKGYKRFDSSTRKDASAGSWEAAISWAPLTYSTVQLVSSRSFADSTGVGDYLENTGTTLSWTHKWATYISSNVSFGRVNTTYSGTGANGRKDDTDNLGVAFYRELGHNFRLGVTWNRTDKDSNQNVNDFKRNVSMITLESVL